MNMKQQTKKINDSFYIVYYYFIYIFYFFSDNIMASSLIALTSRVIRHIPKKHIHIAPMSSYVRPLIGKREIVGFGFNGEPNYVDRSDFPLPAIRWQEPSPDIQVSLLYEEFQ